MRLDFDTPTRRGRHLGKTSRELFMARVTIDDNGCWLWTGAIQNSGYGMLGRGGQKYLAHRFAYTMLVGEIPDGMDIDHKCRVRRCCNPDHLEPVTRHENIMRGAGPALNSQRCRSAETCKRGHAFTAENTRRRKGWRICLQCERDRGKTWRQKRAPGI